MRRIVLAGLVAILALGVLAAPVAAKPPKPAPPPPDATTSFPAGLVCGFDVQLDAWSKEKVRFVVDRHGVEHMIVTGPARQLVTNLETGDSVWIRTDGRVDIWDPGDGTSHLKSKGHTLFYFFPGDQNPAGEGNGLFLVHGKVDQVLDLDANVVTSFDSRGHYRDLCAELS